MNDTFMKEKPVFPLLTSMALPMVASMLVSALYNIVDSLYVARISEEAMTALSLVYPVQNFINAVAIGFSIGISALISLHLGAGNQEKADTAATHGGDALTQGFSAAALDFQVAEDGFREAAFRLEAHGVNHRVDAAMSRRVIDNPLRRVVMGVEVYRDRAIALLREIESVIVMIDDKYLLCAIEPGAGGAQQPYRAGAKNSHAAAGFDLGVFYSLPGGGQNI